MYRLSPNNKPGMGVHVCNSSTFGESLGGLRGGGSVSQDNILSSKFSEKEGGEPLRKTSASSPHGTCVCARIHIHTQAHAHAHIYTHTQTDTQEGIVQRTLDNGIPIGYYSSLQATERGLLEPSTVILGLITKMENFPERVLYETWSCPRPSLTGWVVAASECCHTD